MEKEQHIRIKAIIEIVGKPKEFIADKISEYIAKIKQDGNLMVMSDNILEPVVKEQMFSVIAEIEIVVKGVSNLVGFCIDYMPASIEIIKPEKFEFEERVFTEFVNDIIGKLHTVDMVAKQLGTENNFLKKNISNMIKNNILILVKLGINTIEGISKATAIKEDEIKKFAKKLVEEDRISEDSGVYSLK